MPLGERLVAAGQYVTGIGLERNLGGAERYARLGLGLALLALAAAAVAGSPAAGVAAAVPALLAGGYLVWEAATNYCPVNRALGRDTADGPSQ